MFYGGFSVFHDFRANLVAVCRQGCRVLTTFALAALAGCATAPDGGGSTPVPATPEAKQALVAARAQARWDAMIKDDMATAYGYMSPGSRDAYSLEKFKANTRRGAFREVRIEITTCEGDLCMVDLKLTYDHPKMKQITTPMREAWIIDGGQAWYVYNNK